MTMTHEYSTQELMIIAAAREIQDGERIFVGMRLPITAYGVARLTHAPNAVGLFEVGLAREAPATETLYTMGDPANQVGAVWATGLVDILGHLQGGHPWVREPLVEWLGERWAGTRGFGYRVDGDDLAALSVRRL